MMRYKNEFCDAVLQMYSDGADGISTLNWHCHLHLAAMPNQWQAYSGYGMSLSRIQAHFLSILGDPEAVGRYREAAL